MRACGEQNVKALYNRELAYTERENDVPVCLLVSRACMWLCYFKIMCFGRWDRDTHNDLWYVFVCVFPSAVVHVHSVRLCLAHGFGIAKVLSCHHFYHGIAMNKNFSFVRNCESTYCWLCVRVELMFLWLEWIHVKSKHRKAVLSLLLFPSVFRNR